ncbi:hypothetical protein ASPZODRAFT_166198 [Penicilliopsis zonata CBS 506.65]|uniref:Shelterin complex subunit TPP1/Est3 domain-containing protein n=1 Tax=Penicilliopsis zonata CBS 506.65 TaxID=1073090 RepID=A0A1L9SII6_9EURO|nr:hypothetical protein ASPZODRAFT_166198 [Penicilliopsis zonata CBS 506.65]OJJ46926.1 hypothetical protein ASPZODRAFT_166198 [Penicilliopsis zonata CBS 506.65]
MSSSGGWVIPLVERLIDLGLKKPRSLEVEDDGSNYRLAESTQRAARIVQQHETWKKQVTLTDSIAQINAILTRNSIEQYSRESNSPLFNLDDYKGSLIRLIEFEIVFEYSVSEPRVYLYVERFQIDKEKGKSKTLAPGKLVKNNKPLFRRMSELYLHIKEAEKAREIDRVAEGDAYESDSSTGSDRSLKLQNPLQFKSTPARGRINVQSGTVLHATASQEGFVSQQPGHSHTVDQDFDQRYSTSTTSLLLQHLKPQNKAVGDVAKPRSKGEPQKPSKSPPSASSSEKRKEQSGWTTESSTTLAKNNNNVGHGRLAMGTGVIVHTETNRKSTPVNILAEGEQRSTTSTQVMENPWYGLERIRKRDVNIPEDQDAMTWYWIPPDPGASMPQANVPPRLLAQWNKMVFRRNHPAAEEEIEPPSNVEFSQLVEPHTPASGESDTDYSWEETPENGRRTRLPADSSPPRERSVARAVAAIPVEDISVQDGLFTQPSDPGPDVQSNERPHTRADNVLAPGPALGVMMFKTNELQQGIEDAFVGIAEQPINHESDAESDESVMDTSVPRPLRNSSHQDLFGSQIDEDIASSGQFSASHVEERVHVHVVETPDTTSNRLRPKIDDKGPVGWEAGSSQQFSSQDPNKSSQSRVENTYGSHESQLATTPSQRRPTHLTDLQNNSQDLSIFETQVSNANGSAAEWTDFPFNVTLPYANAKSSNETALPISAARVEGAFQSPLLRDEPTSCQVDGAMDYSGRDSPIENLPVEKMEVSQIAGVKRVASPDVLGASSPSKRQRVSWLVRDESLRSEAPSRRHSYVVAIPGDAEAHGVYEKFRGDYPGCSIEFDHFTKLCFKLHTLRQEGKLQRSFLWDDFIMVHLRQYPDYLQQCLASETKTLSYENYFLEKISRPLYKRRSLTIHGIETCAARQTAKERYSLIAGRPPSRTSSPFTAEVAESLSNLDASSLLNPDQGAAAFDALVVDHVSQIVSPIRDISVPEQKPTSSALGTEQPSSLDQQPSSLGEQLQSSRDQQPSSLDQQPSSLDQQLSSLDEQQLESSRGRKEAEPEDQRSSDVVIESSYPCPASLSQLPVRHEDEDDEEMIEAPRSAQPSHFRQSQSPIRQSTSSQPMRYQDEDEDEDKDEGDEDEDELMEEAHETASIELGDENEHRSVPVDNAMDNERLYNPQLPRHGWFASFSRLYPDQPAPAWSDSANTPFKMWARADLNVLMDRRARGGVALPTDEKGVIIASKWGLKRRE